MCQLKSGIILKNRCFVPDYDSHSDMLDELGIEDTYENACRTFVRVELSPKGNRSDSIFTDVNTWRIKVDQDVIPDWFEEDKDRYINEFKKAVKEWVNVHVLIDKEIDELKEGTYYLLRSKVKQVFKNTILVIKDTVITEMWDNSIISEMYGNSTVGEMNINSTINIMFDNSTVSEMYGDSTVKTMCDHSIVNRMYGNSTISEMNKNSAVNHMNGNSTITKMYDNSIVGEMYRDSIIGKMYDNSTVSKMYGNAIAICNYLNKIYVASNFDVERK